MAEQTKYKREIDYLKDFPGADIERALIRVAISKQDLDLLEAIARNYVWDPDTSKWTVLTKSIISGDLTNINKFGGTAVTGRDISQDFAKLQNLNITLAAFRDALRGTSTKNFSTLEADVESILAKTDISLTSLRDALRGTATRNFTTLQSQFEPDASALPKILKDFYLKAVDTTVPSGETWYIASGEEFAAETITNNGRIWNNGTVFSIDGVYDGTGIYDGTGMYK